LRHARNLFARRIELRRNHLCAHQFDRLVRRGADFAELDNHKRTRVIAAIRAQSQDRGA
jgi:hypothetical protein